MPEDAKLVEARRRVSRAERKALDRAQALRDEALSLLEHAKTQAARIREDAKAEAARIRSEAKEGDPEATASIKADLDAARAENDRLLLELSEAKADAERSAAELTDTADATAEFEQ